MPNKVGVVFVKPNFIARRQLLISTSRALCENSFACLILRRDLPKSGAFWGGIFGMRVDVVETGTVGKNKVAFNLRKAKRAIFIDLVLSRFVGILT